MKILLIAITFILSLQVLAEDQYKIIVAQNGSGDFTSIQQAIDAAKAYPPQRITIFIKNGIYYEKVKIHSWNNNISLIGESVERTIITHDDYFKKINRGRNSTFYTYTMLVNGNDFIAENLTIENSSGDVGQAVALHVEADRCVFRNLRILGNQDALYTAGENFRQYYDHCYIEGTTDFIFGAAIAFFEDCQIHSKSNSYITAASTTEGAPFGLVFKKCKLTAAEGVDSVYLGRPWRNYAQTVFIECELGSHILPEGWAIWSNADDKQTTFYAEFNNIGNGADIKKRVEWSHQLSKQNATLYTKENVFKGSISKEFANWIE